MKKTFLLLVLVLTLILTSCDLNDILSKFDKDNKTNEITEEKSENKYDHIFEDFNDENSKIITENLSNSAIKEKVIVKDVNDEVLGYVYTVSGNNAYGPISLLVGIGADGKLVSAELLENGQSFAKEVETHVNSSYTLGLTLEEITNINTICGATYGANTVKELIIIAYEDYELNK